jgi:hypothetical protein
LITHARQVSFFFLQSFSFFSLHGIASRSGPLRGLLALLCVVGTAALLKQMHGRDPYALP